MPATNTIGEQVLEAVVTGPDGANRLLTCTGIANVQMSLTRTQEQTTETWTFLVGPTLPRPQFYRAIGTASVSLQTVDIQGAPAGFTVSGTGAPQGQWAFCLRLRACSPRPDWLVG